MLQQIHNWEGKEIVKSSVQQMLVKKKHELSRIGSSI